MDVKSLPTTELIGITADTRKLSDMLYETFSSARLSLTYFDIIEGAPRSGRILYQYFADGAQPMPYAMSPDDMARDLLHELRLQARYEKQKSRANKGWEVHRIEINSQRAAVVWAAWVSVL